MVRLRTSSRSHSELFILQVKVWNCATNILRRNIIALCFQPPVKAGALCLIITEMKCQANWLTGQNRCDSAGRGSSAHCDITKGSLHRFKDDVCMVCASTKSPLWHVFCHSVIFKNIFALHWAPSLVSKCAKWLTEPTAPPQVWSCLRTVIIKFWVFRLILIWFKSYLNPYNLRPVTG